MEWPDEIDLAHHTQVEIVTYIVQTPYSLTPFLYANYIASVNCL